MTIVDDNKGISLVMHEPPGKIYHKFLKNRANLYTKIAAEAAAPPRDVAIMGVQKRVFLSETASDAMWHILFSQDSTALQRVDDIAKLSVRKEIQRAEAQEYEASSTDTPGLGSTAPYSAVKEVINTPLS